MAQTNIKVSELVNKVQRGELTLLEMQRRYVWPATRVRNLLILSIAVIRPAQFYFWKQTKKCRLDNWPLEQREHRQLHKRQGKCGRKSIGSILMPSIKKHWTLSV